MSPPLAWTGVPAGTKSFALSFIDTKILDANINDSRGWHWVMWDIPDDLTELPEDIDAMGNMPAAAQQYNPLSKTFLGPCPGGVVDTYELTIWALPTETVTLPNMNNVQRMVEAIEAVALGSATITGTSSAKSK